MNIEMQKLCKNYMTMYQKCACVTNETIQKKIKQITITFILHRKRKTCKIYVAELNVIEIDTWFDWAKF